MRTCVTIPHAITHGLSDRECRGNTPVVCSPFAEDVRPNPPGKGCAADPDARRTARPSSRTPLARANSRPATRRTRWARPASRPRRRLPSRLTLTLSTHVCFVTVLDRWYTMSRCGSHAALAAFFGSVCRKSTPGNAIQHVELQCGIVAQDTGRSPRARPGPLPPTGRAPSSSARTTRSPNRCFNRSHESLIQGHNCISHNCHLRRTMPVPSPTSSAPRPDAPSALSPWRYARTQSRSPRFQT